MEKCNFGIIVLSLSALLVLGNDLDSSDGMSPEVEDPINPSDAFEKTVMERLRPELRERMHNFFRQEPGQISDLEMRMLFERTFNPKEQKEVEKIFTEVVQEQMKSIMGDMGDFGAGVDNLGAGFDNFAEGLDNLGEGLDHFHDHDHFHDDQPLGHSEEDSYVFESEEDDSGNESTKWDSKKKFVLEPSETLGDDRQEKGEQSDDGEDEIINPTSVKDEF